MMPTVMRLSPIVMCGLGFQGLKEGRRAQKYTNVDVLAFVLVMC